MATLFIQRPWAISVIQEVKPTNVWPASGNFAKQGNLDTNSIIKQNFNQSDSTGLLEQFDQGDGSAFVAIKNGEIIFSTFEEEYTPDTKFNSFSMVKALVGVLVLKAVSDEKIESLDTTVAELWPEAKNSKIADVPIRNLMDMTSGIAFEKNPGEAVEEFNAINSPAQMTWPLNKLENANFLIKSGPFSNFGNLHTNGVEAVLHEAKLVETDIGKYGYQNFNTALLGRILEEAYQKPLDQILFEEIVEPAGADGFYWRQYTSEERISPYCCLYATVEWWAKVANYLMDNGKPTNKMLNEELFSYFMGDDLTEQTLKDGEYRSQIRYDTFDREGEQLKGTFMYFSGLGGQIVYIVPQENLVIVRFGKKYQLLHSTVYETSKFENKSYALDSSD